MAMWKKEIETWLATLGDLDEVAVDEGGLILVACDPGGGPNGAYLEVGGVTEEEDEDGGD